MGVTLDANTFEKIICLYQAIFTCIYIIAMVDNPRD